MKDRYGPAQFTNEWLDVFAHPATIMGSKNMTPQQIFEEQIAGRLADPAQQASAKELDAVYQFHVTGDNGGDWVVDLQNCAVSSGTNGDAHCTITIDANDFVGLVDGSVQGPQLFMMGKLQIAGNMALAMKLGEVLR